ncbi:MAG: hypothetical protein H6742_19340 [Alphaproteobacteria bacterium]|nr:hypothetical protein [Alphaproteobacteria bacterium]
MRNLVHRLGCFLQLLFTAGLAAVLLGRTELSPLVALLAAAAGGMVATFGTVFVLQQLVDRFED